MTMTELLNMEFPQLEEHGSVTIVAFGDSVTHGAVAPGEMDYESVYWNRLRRMLNARRSYVPVNVINAGIGGVTATQSVGRLQRDVLCHHPDVIIVCFGLNDINDPLERFTASLKTIFEACLATGAQVLFLTPNMLNTYVHPETEEKHRAYAAVTAAHQNSGRMDDYMAAACRTAQEAGVTVCDAYARWKALQQSGTDTTALLANHINHPQREMHALFAQCLYDALFPSGDEAAVTTGETMYPGREAR